MGESDIKIVNLDLLIHKNLRKQTKISKKKPHTTVWGRKFRNKQVEVIAYEFYEKQV